MTETQVEQGVAEILIEEDALRERVAELGADADPFMLHLYAALAEKERRQIAERTGLEVVTVALPATPILGGSTLTLSSSKLV